MRIIGKRVGGETAVYEIIGFRYMKEEDGTGSINCTLTDGMMLNIAGINQSISVEQNEMYCLEIFNNGFLNLLNENVVLDMIYTDQTVTIDASNYGSGIPVSIEDIRYTYLDGDKIRVSTY